MNATTRKLRRSTRLIASASGMALAALLTLAPAASAAAPFELCPLEQGPEGVQCQKPPVDKPNFEMCKLEQGPKGPQCQKPPVDKPEFEICELEEGPDGLQCAGSDSEDPGPDPGPDLEEPQPQPEPEPQPDPETGSAPQGGSKPKGQLQAKQPAAGGQPAGTGGHAPAAALQVASEDPGNTRAQSPDFAVVESDSQPPFGWIALALVTAAGMFALGRRSRRSEESALDR